jgi:hypothetical protein
MEQKEKVFADGFIFKRREDAPDFVIGRLSIKVDEAIAFLRQNEKNGWVNLDAKYGRSGNPYLELDTYEGKGNDNHVEKSAPSVSSKPSAVEDDEEDLPF